MSELACRDNAGGALQNAGQLPARSCEPESDATTEKKMNKLSDCASSSATPCNATVRKRA
eukprot:11180614-Lingulodinium_polyedra.AAC.1